MTATLIIDIRSYWHAGTGRGSGSHLDALVEKDEDGLPYLPGKTVKGLLRDALRLYEHWEKKPAFPLTTELFGKTGEEGSLHVSNASIPDNERAALVSHDKLIPLMYTSLFSTAIDHERGAYTRKSLRGMEAVLPMHLHARLAPLKTNVSSDWLADLHKSLPLVRAIGAHRNRGLGRAIFTLAAMEGSA